MNAPRRLLAMAALAFATFAPQTPASPGISASDERRPPQSTDLDLHTCTLPQVEGNTYCGTFRVYENRITNTGRTILLKVVVLSAFNAKPDSPVFWLAGGPGAAATDLVPAANNGFFKSLRDRHDLVFVDQRGTGGSNPLMCDLADDPSDLPAYFGELLPLEKVRACRTKLQAIADLTMYTTPIAMDDLDDVRAALGYNKINIAASSYGSLAAQIYIRRHSRHARAVVIAGVATPALKQPLPFAKAAQNALNLTFKACEADEACHTAFPDIRIEFQQVLSRFDGAGLPVAFVDLATHKEVTVRLPRDNFVERIRLLLYNTNSARFLPCIIHRAYLGDFMPFELISIRRNPAARLARGMYLSVTCSEGIPFITEREIQRETQGTFVADHRVRVHIEACKEWPRAKVPRAFIAPVKSRVPVLMISGEADGSTPPWLGAEAIKHFPNGRQISIPEYGHQLDSACVWSIMNDFIQQGTAQHLDTSCTSQMRRPPFATELPKELSLN